MCNSCRSLTELQGIRDDVKLFAEEQLSAEAAEWADALTKNIGHFEASASGQPIPEWDDENGEAGMSNEDVPSPKEFLTMLLGGNSKPEAPKIPTMDELAQAALTQQEIMRPFFGTVGFVRMQLIEQGFSETAAEQTAANFFLQAMARG